MKKLVGSQKLGFVATVCPDGTPNLSPKGTTRVWGDEQLVFADNRSPRTVSNIRQNPAVEVNVVDFISRKGFRFKGKGEVITDGKLFEEVLKSYENEVRDARRRIRSLVLVKVQSASPLISPGYDFLDESQTVKKWRSYYLGRAESGPINEFESE